jgi:hypothetical protein
VFSAEYNFSYGVQKGLTSVYLAGICIAKTSTSEEKLAASTVVAINQNCNASIITTKVQI